MRINLFESIIVNIIQQACGTYLLIFFYVFFIFINPNNINNY